MKSFRDLPYVLAIIGAVLVGYGIEVAVLVGA